MRRAIFPILIVGVSVLTFLSAFNLALFGDDWLAFFRYSQYLGPSSDHSWNHITYFLTSYGPQDIMMGLLEKIYSYNSYFYQLTSFILRLIAAFSIYPLAFYLTKNKYSSLLAVLFLSVTSIGLETTNWVFNMPSYFAIIFLNLFFYFYLRAKETNKMKFLFPAGLFFFTSILSQPIRMHGLLPFIFIMEISWLFQNCSKTVLKQALLRFGYLFLIFLIIFWGLSGSPVVSGSKLLNDDLSSVFKLINERHWVFLFNPIIILGSLFFPESIIQFQTKITQDEQIIFSLLLPIFLIFQLIFIFLIKNISSSISVYYRKFLILSIFWSIIALLIYKINQNELANANYMLNLITGGYIIITWIFLFVKLKKDQKVAPLVFSFWWILLSFLLAWARFPESILLTTHRYLIVSAVGVVLFLTTLASFGKSYKNKVYLSLFVVGMILLNIISTRNYLQQQQQNHGINISNKIWSAIPNIRNVIGENGTIVFYFEGDGTNTAIMHDVITFGFPSHMALIYKITKETQMPIALDIWKEIESAVIDGKSLAHYGYPLKPIPPENVYAFYLQGNDNLINITDLARNKLIQLKK